jgi:hypothetical protein
MAYTTIDDPSAYFQALTYTGTGTNGQAFTFDGNSDLQPDFLWGKRRDTTANHILSNTNVDFTYFVSSNNSNAENTAGAKFLTSDTDGFTCGTSGNVNASGGTYVAWGWKANGGTTSSNTSGTITSTIQSDTTAGFCIATYTGNGTTGATYGHNLGVAPDIIFTKNLTSGSTDWSVDGSIGDMVYGTNKLILNTTGSLTADTNNVTGASSTLITVGNGANCNQNTSSHVAYLFAEKQGFSKFGKYVGNGSTTNGPFVYTGFKPAFVMIKATDAAKNWVMVDNKRIIVNGDVYLLYANTSGGEVQSPSSGAHIDLLSNGFKIYDNYTLTNQNGVNYLYMAFAENPFVTSTGIPTTAR